MSKVPSMEAEGILKACTIKLVPKSASSTVTSSDSIYSEIVVVFHFLFGRLGRLYRLLRLQRGFLSHSLSAFPTTRALHSLQQFHRALRRSLFRLFFCAASTAGHTFAADPNFYRKHFLMIGPLSPVRRYSAGG